MYFTLMSKPIRESQNVLSKTVSRRNKLLIGKLNTWSYVTGVMCILTRKCQGAFCRSPYGVESLLNFMFSFKDEISL